VCVAAATSGELVPINRKSNDRATVVSGGCEAAAASGELAPILVDALCDAPPDQLEALRAAPLRELAARRAAGEPWRRAYAAVMEDPTVGGTGTLEVLSKARARARSVCVCAGARARDVAKM